MCCATIFPVTRIEALRALHRTQCRMLAAAQALDILELKEPDMAVSADAATLITEFDTATNGVAARIQRLVNNPATGLSADDKAAFQAEIDKLTLMGQDPANPLPPAVTA